MSAFIDEVSTKEHTATWSIYIIETRYNHWYTGITNDVSRRFEQHQLGKGAKALVGKGPLKLVCHFVVGNRSDASKLEYKIKQLTKKQKIAWAKSCQQRGNVVPID